MAPRPVHQLSHAMLLSQAINKQNKRLGGTHGDAALLNWFLAAAIVVASITVIVLSNNFLNKYAKTTSGRDVEDYYRPYRVTQYVMGLAIITVAFESLYVLWVFMDSRHPMRKAWNYAKDQTEGGMPMQVDGTTQWPYPAIGTMRFDRMHRFTTSRLFAERNHIQKLMIFQALLFIAWLVPGVLLAFDRGYINFERSKHNKNVTVTQLCGIERSRNLCMELAKAGITTAVIAIIIFIALISSLIGYLAKKTITPAQQGGPAELPG